MRILRVFPKKNSYTPDDDMAFFGRPPFRELIPEHDEVHVSCVFTWDYVYCTLLADYWRDATDKPVKIGGPGWAYFNKTPFRRGFQPGLYIKPEYTFTSRGCDNACPWCSVPKVEGSLKELNGFHIRRIIQDNNFLQTSRSHREVVYGLLKSQKRICFRGGLEASRIDMHFIENIQWLAISELWLACDTPNAVGRVTEKIRLLSKAGFNNNKLYCYVLIGDDMEENEDRCRAIYNAGAMPRAQLFYDFSAEKTKYSSEWKKFASMWQRPPATIAHMEKGTDWRDF